MRLAPNQKPDPTPEEIRERCREIQATWPPRIERDRRVVQDSEVEVREHHLGQQRVLRKRLSK